MKSSEAQLQHRGFIDDEDIRAYKDIKGLELVSLVQHGSPTQRSIAVRILSAKQGVDYIAVFIDALKIEKALYTKIELQKALAKAGQMAIPQLVDSLGAIGNNQHKTINNADIKKKTFPLARDLAARILCSIGPRSMPSLVEVLNNGSRMQKLEALDAIGYIVYHYDYFEIEETLIDAFHKSNSDPLVRWKTIKAMQGFVSDQVQKILQDIITSKENVILKNEAKRSLSKVMERRQAK